MAKGKNYIIKPQQVNSMTLDEDVFQIGALWPSTVASQYVEEMVNLILVIHSHLCGTLCTQHWMVDLVLGHPSQTAVCGSWLGDLKLGDLELGDLRLGDLRLCVHLLVSPLVPLLLLLPLWCFVLQNLLFVDRAVHYEHCSVLRPEFLMSVVRTRGHFSIRLILETPPF